MTPPDSPKPKTCPRCDRAECKRAQLASEYRRLRSDPTRGLREMSDLSDSYDDAVLDCERRAVDWRARALAAESRTADIARDVATVRTFVDCAAIDFPDADEIDEVRAALSRIGAAK